MPERKQPVRKDSHGEFVYTIMEYYRYTRDVGFLAEYWPAVVKAVAAMEILRGDHSVLSREVRRYSRADLRNRLTAAGFIVERITYTNAENGFTVARLGPPSGLRRRPRRPGATTAW